MWSEAKPSLGGTGVCSWHGTKGLRAPLLQYLNKLW